MKSVDIAAWDRKEIYDLFSACDHPFYSVSFELDVTNLYAHTHESGLSFYYSLCYLMTRAMEEVEAFRMRIRDGRIDIVDELIPSCTDLVPGSDAFVIVTLPHGGDMAEFCRQAKERPLGRCIFSTARWKSWIRSSISPACRGSRSRASSRSAISKLMIPFHA